MIAWIIRILRALADTIWPRGFMCLICDDRAEGDRFLCDRCADELRSLRYGKGPEYVRSAYLYKGAAKRLVINLKYNTLGDAAEVLAEAMAEDVQAMHLPADTVLTWVAMPPKRRRQRGIDHGRRLCEAVGRRTGLPVRQLLVRTRKVRTQRGLNFSQRQKNLKGVFDCPDPIAHPVLLVDDVMTSGATTRICSEQLMAAGAPAVYVVTATRVMLHDISDSEITKG